MSAALKYSTASAAAQQTFTIYKSKVSPSRRLKNLLKPLLGRVFKSKSAQPKRSSYIACAEKEAEFEWLQQDFIDNMANERLEHRLVEELQQCEANDAIVIYDECGTGRLETFEDKEDLFVPVHFARTDEGTFFWTSVQRETIQPYQIEWNFLDRWAQA